MPLHKSLIAGALLLAPLLAAGQSPARSKQALADLLIEWMQVRYPSAPSEGYVLYVSVRSQRLYLVVEGEMQQEYVISTAANGLGAWRNSMRSPEGLHRVVRKIGDGAPPRGIFRYRQFTGEVAGPHVRAGDLITSRILWLDGLEPGVNKGGAVDSSERGIYIHGTADETTLGTPSSHGCIRMSNRDVIALYEHVPEGTLVVILDN